MLANLSTFNEGKETRLNFPILLTEQNIFRDNISLPLCFEISLLPYREVKGHQSQWHLRAPWLALAPL